MRKHGTTERIMIEHLAEECAALQRLPAGRFAQCCALSAGSATRAASASAATTTAFPTGHVHGCSRSRLRPIRFELSKTARSSPYTRCCRAGSNTRYSPGHRQVRSTQRRERAALRLQAGHRVLTRHLGVHELIAQPLGAVRLRTGRACAHCFCDSGANRYVEDALSIPAMRESGIDPATV